MEKITVNLFELSDSEKAKLLEQARTYLQQQIEEAKLSKSVITVFQKYGLIT